MKDENWEDAIDWSKRTDLVVPAPCGWLRPIGKQPSLAERVPSGPIFCEFIRPQAIPVLDEGLKEMAAAKAACENKMRRWSGITERAQKLSECFTALVEDADFMRMIDDFDERTSERFKGERIPTLGGWVRLGIRFTAAMRDGSSVPAKYTVELNAIQREIAAATAVRNILRSFGSARDHYVRLRCASERFRTRVFRNLAQDFNDIIASSATIDFAKLPDTVNGITDALKVIIDVAKKMQSVCRRAKKDMKRLGSFYWSKLDAWDALRRAV